MGKRIENREKGRVRTGKNKRYEQKREENKMKQKKENKD